MDENPTPNEQAEDSTGATGASDESTALGVTQNVVGLLAYLAMWLTGIVFLLIEKDNKFVRFHAMQSIVIFVPLTIASLVVGFVPILGGFLGVVVQIATVVIWLLMMFQAFQGKMYKFPMAGDYAEKQLDNMANS